MWNLDFNIYVCLLCIYDMHKDTEYTFIFIYIWTICTSILNDPEYCWCLLILLVMKMPGAPNYFLMWYVETEEYQFLTFQASSFNCFHLHYRVIPPVSLILYLHYKRYKLTPEREEDSKKGKKKRDGETTSLYLVHSLKNILLRLISDIHLRIWFSFPL